MAKEETKVEDKEVDPNETKTYTLKEGMEHTVIKNGEAVTRTGGQTVELNAAQYEAFADKLEAEPAKKGKGDDATESQPMGAGGPPAADAKPAESPLAPTAAAGGGPEVAKSEVVNA